MLQHDAEATRIYHRLACFSTGPKCVGVVCILWARPFLLGLSRAHGGTPASPRVRCSGPGPVLLGAFSALGQALSFLARSALWARPFLSLRVQRSGPGPFFPCAFSALGQALSFLARSALRYRTSGRILYKTGHTPGTQVFHRRYRQFRHRGSRSHPPEAGRLLPIEAT